MVAAPRPVPPPRRPRPPLFAPRCHRWTSGRELFCGLWVLGSAPGGATSTVARGSELMIESERILLFAGIGLGDRQ